MTLKHNLKTIWNKVIATTYDKPERKNELLSEIEATIKELEQRKQKLTENGNPTKYAQWELINEILGKQQ